MSDFVGMLKHVGMLNNTGKNVVVVYMQLPGDTNSALVVDTDALPDNYNDSLRRIVESIEGQQSENLAEVLARRMSPDGSNTTLLAKFHQSGRLQKVPVSLVTMTPRKGIRWPLSDVVQAMASAKESTPDGFNDLDPETRAALMADLKKFNVHANNLQGEATAVRTEEAVGLIRQAELLEADAQNMRQRAYKMDPRLVTAMRARKAKAASDAAESLETFEAIQNDKVLAESNDKTATKTISKVALVKSPAVKKPVVKKSASKKSEVA